MHGKREITFGSVAMSVALLLGMFFPTAAASASPAAPTKAPVAATAGFWACSVPAGFTYDQVVNQLGVCSPFSFAFSYHLITPADAVWACSVPAGFTYDQVVNQLSVCSPSNFASSYHLRQ
jgi:hypothetical protein